MADAQPSSIPLPDVRLSYGPMLMGVFVNMILYGVLIVQTYTYYQWYKTDAKWIKYLIFYLLVIETANTGIDMAMMFQALVEQYGHKLQNFPILFAAEPITVVLISTPIQLFFAWRIKVLTKQNILAAFISTLAIVSFGGGIWTTAKIAIIKEFKRKPELHIPALVWFLTATVADIMITATLVINLSRRKTGFAATDSAISKIVRMTVQTGMITALFALGDVIFFMTLERTGLNFIWDLALTKLYANCLLSTLNARKSLKEMSSYSNQGGNFSTNAHSRRRHNAYLEPMTPIRVQGPDPVFEMDKSYGGTSSQHYSQQDDMEYGITITKVIETVPDQSINDKARAF